MMRDTPIEDVPVIIEKTASKADEWKDISLETKIQILKQIVKNCIEYQDEWLKISQEARGVDPTDPRQGIARADILNVGPGLFGSYANGILKSLKCISKTGTPPPPKAFRVVDGGAKQDDNHCIVRALPHGLLEMTEGVGMTGELVLKGNKPEQVSLADTCVGGVTGVLGAGNFDAPTEVLCEMFLKGRCVIYKPNPVNQNINPVMQKILEPLVSHGFLSFVMGGADVGSALVGHAMLDQIVLTGGVNTYEKIKPLAKAPICSELGAVNPWIIVPGSQWNHRTVDTFARNLASAKMLNNGHICASPQVIVLSKDWPWRQEFLDRTKFWLQSHAGSPPFYPNSAESHRFFKEFPNAEHMESAEGTCAFENQQCPVLIPNVTHDCESQNTKDIFTREAFCPILAEVPIDCPTDDPMKFLRSAVHFTEENLYGSLTATILIDNKTMKNYSNELDRLIVQMKYGIVGVNVYPAFVTSMAQLTWGAFPGKSDSGSGLIGNTFLFKDPQKTVLRVPFNW
eukprot:CAMPEP_0195289906 /NCGR_PEP_ID=MMETSP0707-20130614/5988_1 /TAXON_ID=33640 /ORGANISM="Asterionellopsis glacialis, Strain CCMP134" /LENGTH=512 /DNA_ID=CAMNT_0040349965 /DNA_START=123 /DNA_END=1658 /DNA_ORIENTATION=+